MRLAAFGTSNVKGGTGAHADDDIPALGKTMAAICERANCLDLLQVTCDACCADVTKRPDFEKIMFRLALLLSDEDSSDSDQDSDMSSDSDESDNSDGQAKSSVSSPVAEIMPAVPSTTLQTNESIPMVNSEDTKAAIVGTEDPGLAEDQSGGDDDLDFFALLNHHKEKYDDGDWSFKIELDDINRDKFGAVTGAQLWSKNL